MPGHRLPVAWSVRIDGLDVTSRMNRFITGIEITGNAGKTADTARLTFDDADGQCILPKKGSDVEITLEGRLRFKGYTDAPEAILSRGGGQTLEVSCSGFDKTGKVKQAIALHKDDCTLQDFLDTVARKAEVSAVRIDPDFAAIRRAYWSTRGRNFLALGQALADELGGTFKLRGNVAVLAKRGQGAAPGGGRTPTVTIRRPGNLIEARIRPFEGRSRYGTVRVRRYDRKAAKHVEEEIEVGNAPGGRDVADLLGEARPDADAAKRAGEGRKTDSEREAGSGSCTILLDVEIEAEGTAILEGIRPGVDGTYRIESWTDRVDRSGAETEVTLKQPQGTAGEDDRSGG